MDVVEKARELGKVIQQDARYLAYMEARKVNEADGELNALIEKLNRIQLAYQEEDGKAAPDETVKAGYDRAFRETYALVMQNPNMAAYQEAKADVDDMMNYLMRLLALCVNGEDPDTCEVPEDCTGNCSGCAGCH